MLKKLIHRDFAITNWKESMLNDAAGDHSGIWLEPLRAVVLGKERELGGMTRSAACGTQWTQDRVAKAGYADKSDSKCRRCSAAEGTRLAPP